MAYAFINETFILLETGCVAFWWFSICRSTYDRITVGLYVYLEGFVHPLMKACIYVSEWYGFFKGDS